MANNPNQPSPSAKGGGSDHRENRVENPNKDVVGSSTAGATPDPLTGAGGPDDPQNAAPGHGGSTPESRGQGGTPVPPKR